MLVVPVVLRHCDPQNVSSKPEQPVRVASNLNVLLAMNLRKQIGKTAPGFSLIAERLKQVVHLLYGGALVCRGKCHLSNLTAA